MHDLSPEETTMTAALLPTYAPYPFVISHGTGDRVIAEDGAVYLDFYGGHCVASTGHAHPKVVEAIASQASKLLFYSTAGDLRIRHQAAEKLVAFASVCGTASVFFCNSGAEANENALKVAKKLTGRSTILSFDGGWHGRSLACLAATEDHKITAPYVDWLPPSVRMPFNDIEALAAQDWSDVAAVIVEPIQSMAGIKMVDREWLAALRQHCDDHGVVLIFDEIQTGVGRLGTPFAADFFGVTPDIITSAKGLASGVPIGAVLVTAQIAASIRVGDLGSTFGGGPLAMAALIATLEVIESEDLMSRATALEDQLRKGLHGTAVRDVRGAGLLLGLVSPLALSLREHYYSHRILVGGSSDPEVLRLMPPLVLSDAAVEQFITVTKAHRA